MYFACCMWRGCSRKVESRMSEKENSLNGSKVFINDPGIPMAKIIHKTVPFIKFKHGYKSEHCKHSMVLPLINGWLKDNTVHQ